MSRISVRSAPVRVRVFHEDELLADSRDALELSETGHALVYYLPRAHVRMDRLVRTDRRTHCPWKGDAAYFSVAGGPENAVWSYEEPLEAVRDIRERLAFYANKVRIEVSQ
ncbi:MAG TPA: DUF427 domain-containing protein [Burkholderiales bacterium]|nr:DUF427 domain-containing protein [Burkholderiales bacterium]